MSDIIAVLLADADRAADALRALEARHARGCLTIFGVALLDRAADGGIHLLRPPTPGPRGALLARLVGMLVGSCPWAWCSSADPR